MSFGKALQNQTQEQLDAVLEYQNALGEFQLACKVYSGFRLAADYPGAPDAAVVAEVRARKEYKITCRKYYLARAKFVSLMRYPVSKRGNADQLISQMSNFELYELQDKTNAASIIQQRRELAMKESLTQREYYLAWSMKEDKQSGESIKDTIKRSDEEYARATQLNGGVEPAWDQVQHILAPAAPTTPEEIKTNISTNTVEPLTVEEFAILTARDFSSTDSEAAATDDTVRIIKPTVKEDFTLDMSDTI